MINSTLGLPGAVLQTLLVSDNSRIDGLPNFINTIKNKFEHDVTYVTCVSVSMVELAWGVSATNWASLKRFSSYRNFQAQQMVKDSMLHLI